LNILDLVSTSLESLNIITVYGWYDESLNDTHITFLEFNNLEDEFADDEALTEEHYITVDLWTKDIEESQNLKKQIKELLKKSNFIYQDGADQFESDTGLYHITTRWLIIENL
jgi:hypothetical protein